MNTARVLTYEDDPIELAMPLAKVSEGCRLYPYYDPVGYPTIGHGHLLSRTPWAGLGNWSRIDRAEAERLLIIDLRKAARSVYRLCPVPLKPTQLAALIDFTFNVGGGNLEISTLRRAVNRGDFNRAAEQFGRWVYARGVKLPGLVRRRAAEREMFLS